MKILRIPLAIALLVEAGLAFNADARNNPVLYTFGGYPTDGTHPLDRLVQGSDGNFYGTTSGGGSNNAGIVFAITAQGTFSALHSFDGDDGYSPWAGLVQGTDSNFYGTTEYGGVSNAGGVFQITSAGTFTLLHSFIGSDGQYPLAGLVQGTDSNFYGTTTIGGTNGAGTVFKMTAQGTLTTLYQFSGGSDGSNIWAGLVQGNDGNFYGTAKSGGTNGFGTVFKMTAQGTLTTLYQFSSTDGDTPLATLAQGSDSNFYGTTSGGGPHGAGTVFRISSVGAFTTWYSFSGPDGNGPSAGLVPGLDGNFYGTTFAGGTSTNCGGGCGAVFQITPAGTLTVVYSFSGGSDGSSIRAGLVQGMNSNFYGSASYGGTNDDGTVFKLFVPFPNSWISAGGGKWEVGTNWSLGAAPSTTDAAEFVTNTSTKTVIIDATTATSFPGTMTINNLTVSAPLGSTNMLYLSNSGLVTNVLVNPGFEANAVSNDTQCNFMTPITGWSLGGVASYGSVDSGGPANPTVCYPVHSGIGALAEIAGENPPVVYQSFAVTPGQVWSMTGYGYICQTVCQIVPSPDFRGLLKIVWIDANGNAIPPVEDNNLIGGLDPAPYYGITSAPQLTNSSTPDTWTFLQCQGTVPAGCVTGEFFNITVGSAGLCLFDDESAFLVTTAPLDILNGFTISTGGALLVTNSVLRVDSMSGGSFSIDGGVVVTSNGVLIATNNLTAVGNTGVGQMTVSNGTVLASQVNLGNSSGARGTLTIAGGNSTFSSFLNVGASASATGAVWVTGGQLTVTNSTAVGVSGVGRMTVSNGTVTVGSLIVTNNINGSIINTNVFNLDGGVVNSAGAAITNGLTFTDGDGVDAATYYLLGGVHSFANGLRVRTNAMLSGCGTINGTMVVDAGGAVQANCGSTINFSGGTLTNNGTITASNSTVLNFYGPVVNTGVIDATGGSVHFFSTLNGTGSVLLPPTNHWIDGTGKWETGTNWSSGVGPSLADSADSIGNAGNNTITIDAITSSNFPSTLTISNLIVNAPGPFTNALLLTDAGTNTPLLVLTSASVGKHGSVLLTNSALQVGGASGGALTVDGQLTMNSGTILVSSNLLVGLSNPLSLVTIQGGALYVTNAAHTAVTEVRFGTLVLTGGVYLTDSLLMTNTGASFLNDGGTFNITGQGQVDQGTQTVASGTTQLSSNLVVGTSANSTGTVNVTGGQLIATNAPITIGDLGVGNMTVSNGTVSTTGVDIGAGTNSQGTLTLQDGSTVTVSSNLTAGSASGATGTVSVTGGQLVATNGVIGVGNDGTTTNGFGVGSMTVSNGTVLGSSILLGSSAGGQGQLTVQTSGLVSLVGTDAVLVANDLTVDGGDVEIVNGQIFCGESHPGAMTMSNGTANCQITYVGYDSQGTLTMLAGQMTVSSLLEIGFAAGSTGSVWMSGGQLTATALATTIGNQGVGQMSISNGIVTTADVFVGNSSNPGTLTLAGGTLTMDSLVLLNPTSRFNFTGGWLNALGITNSNGQTLTLGNGVSPITLNLVGGISSLGNGLRIATNATISGSGTITGNVVNYGLISPGNGVLNFTGGVLTNYGTILATPGGAINFSGTVVNNGLVLTNGGIHFLGVFVNHGLLLDPTADTDGDGMNNLSEALAGTNPTNGASLFHMMAVTTIGNDVRVSWSTVGGKSYVVQSAPITSGGYTNYFADLSPVILMPGIGESTTNFLDVGGATGTPSRYYRVRLGP